MLNRRTYRMVEGDRVEGTWRPIFIRNGGYHLTELFIFADGAIHCWEWVDLDGLRRKIEQGWVATSLRPGDRASVHHLAAWRFEDPHMWISGEELIGEVADEIDQLNGRPDSTGRCLRALGRYLDSRTEDDRIALREAYDAIPGHLCTYALGDMDYGDAPLSVLAARVGEPVGDLRNLGDEEVVTEELRQRAFAYFADRDRHLAEYEDTRRRPADGPEDADAPTVHLDAVVFPQGWPDDLGVLALRNECPAPVTVTGLTYPTVTHAYWALSTTDGRAAERIRGAERPYEAERLGEAAPRRDGWPQARVAVMASLLRAKFDQHPDLAETLLTTGDGRIRYTGLDSAYWISKGDGGRNWIGRLLEVVRSELAAHRAGIPL
ncbi:hypothetical protein GCM10027176_69620 [Actinoallomurus bryophytorum]|uniref:Putative NAD-dependent protein-ADP-ribosyltransferase YbiA (DUF1768 family) n=1 Tax=Actinoallomurus bryophytorum TaxID=1490222 RepID=A0A543CU64_9ACTN|nr:NADAR family protein [Actinoallomurus bryophytorum]TQM00655.1 putative NAD-dependent protein-ADP-ribosyltransferase YbiA (DUF1768 family) [Actinoallomurus bryophytorum]